MREAQEVGEAQALADRLVQLKLSVTMKAGETGTLYGSVTNGDIAALLEDKGIRIDRRRIVLDEPIKTLGEHELSIRLHRKVRGRVKLEVVAEESAES